MIYPEINWTKKEFKAYVLLYCANSDYLEKGPEVELIKSIVDEATYRKVHQEIEEDNSYVGERKIEMATLKFQYQKEEIEELLDDIKKVFFADGDYGTLERNIFKSLKQLFEEKLK